MRLIILQYCSRMIVGSIFFEKLLGILWTWLKMIIMRLIVAVSNSMSILVMIHCRVGRLSSIIGDYLVFTDIFLYWPFISFWFILVRPEHSIGCYIIRYFFVWIFFYWGIVSMIDDCGLYNHGTFRLAMIIYLFIFCKRFILRISNYRKWLPDFSRCCVLSPGMIIIDILMAWLIKCLLLRRPIDFSVMVIFDRSVVFADIDNPARFIYSLLIVVVI